MKILPSLVAAGVLAAVSLSAHPLGAQTPSAVEKRIADEAAARADSAIALLQRVVNVNSRHHELGGRP